MRGHVAAAAVLIFAVFSEGQARALELEATAGLLHLPSSSYHYFGYATRLSFGSGEPGFFVDFGMTPPYSAYGYSQAVYFGGAGLSWTASGDFFRPFVAVGAGVFTDSVSSSSGWTPSLVLQGGVKLGGRRLGVLLEMSSYLGVFDSSQLSETTIWPLINFMGGLYVAL